MLCHAMPTCIICRRTSYFFHIGLNLQGQEIPNVVPECSCFHYGQTNKHGSGLMRPFSFLQRGHDSLASKGWWGWALPFFQEDRGVRLSSEIV